MKLAGVPDEKIVIAESYDDIPSLYDYDTNDDIYIENNNNNSTNKDNYDSITCNKISQINKPPPLPRNLCIIFS